MEDSVDTPKGRKSFFAGMTKSKRNVQVKQELEEVKQRRSNKKRPQINIFGFNLMNLVNAGTHKEVSLRNLGTENIVNADLMQTTQGGIQPGDAKDLDHYDRTGRTVMHRAALEQNYWLIQDLCNQARDKPRRKFLVLIDKKDKFGNTPLLLSCILNISESNKKRARCIEIFLEEGARVDTRNSRTMWSPVMWCAYYGDKKSLNILIEKGARCHYPDNKGHFPVDEAGMRGYGDVVELIFKTVLNEIQYLEDHINNQEDIFEKYGESEKYLRSPLHRCSLLYWACYFKLNLLLIDKLLSFQDVIPEFPIISQLNKNSIHACCQSGYYEGLDLLLNKSKEIREKLATKPRRTFMATENTGRNKEGNKKGKRKGREYLVLVLNNEEKRKFKQKFQKSIQNASAWYSMYYTKLNMRVKEEINFFDTKDMLGNTPLHLASYMGFDKCAALLLQNGANIETANNEGWLCKELRIHENINKLYRKHIEGALNIRKDLTSSIVQKVGMELLDFRSLLSSMKNQNQSKIHSETSMSLVETRKSMRAMTKKSEVNIQTEIASFSKQKQIPDLVIKFKIDPKASNRDFLRKRMDFYLQILIKASFDVYLTPSLYEGTFLIMLKMDDETLSRECTQLGFQMKRVDSFLYEPYDEKRKTEFEPFRSLQRQQIAISVLKKFIDVDLLKEQKIISDYFRMHTVAGAEKLRNIWINHARWYWPQPLGQIMSYVTENKNHTYIAINSMKQYFGEKIAFYFAFASFFTCALVFLAIPGIALQIYLFYRLYILKDADQMYDTPFVAIWVLYVIVWNTVTVERWKRKNAEITTQWGLLNSENSAEIIGKQVRKEFVGDECISGTTGALTKKYKVPVTTITFIASLPVLFILLAGIVGSFILTYKVKTFGQTFRNGDYSFVFQLVAGFINGFIIAVLTVGYSQMARWFVKKENHKYRLYEERSLIFKSFAFRFLSSFIGVAYVAFFELDKKNQQVALWEIFILLVSLVSTKQGGSVATLTILPWLKYKLTQRGYFKLARRKGIKQDDLGHHEEPHSPHSPTKRSDSLEPSFNSNPKRQGTKNSGQIFKRPVLDLRRGLATDEWELSQVELNGIRIKYIDLVDSYGELFVLLGYITLFASAFPLGPALALLNSILDSKFRLYCFLNVLGRPAQVRSNGIGNWLEIWEFISIASIFTNLILLYNHVNFGIDEFIIFNQTSDFSKLFVFVIAEHVLLLLKWILAFLIPDKPRWVFREEEKQKYIEDIEYETIKAREAQLQNTVKEITQAFEATKLEQKMALAHRELEIALQTIEKLKSEQKKAESEETKNLENLDLRWAVKTMLHACFTSIERELIIERIADIADINNTALVVKCTNCTQKKAIIECKQSREFVCKKCYFTVQSKLNFADLDVDILPFIAGDGEIDPEIKREVDRVRKVKEQKLTSGGRIETARSISWKKFEYFSFPTTATSEQYSDLQRVFKMLYEIYITEAGIDPENKVNDVNKFLKLKTQASTADNESMDTIPSTRRALGVRKPAEKSVFKGELDHGVHKAFGKLRDDQAFNSEEKLLLNRIAFLVFKRNGANTKFADFFKLVKSLQGGPFESKIYLLFDLLDEDDDGLITLSDLKRIVRMSYMQSATLKNQCEKILEEIIHKDENLDKKEVLVKLIGSPDAKAIFSSMLQV